MISEFAAILRSGVLPGIGTVPASSDGFKSWVLSAAYVPNVIDEKRIILSRANLDKLSKSLSFDYERFALSAHESFLISMSEQKEFGSLAWPLLKSYYAAFFSAHAIMRSRGAGVIKIEKSQSKKMTEILQIYNPESKIITPGMYMISCKKMPIDDVGEVSILFDIMKDGKGVHEGFWDCFSCYIENEASDAAKEGRPDNADFVAYASALKEALIVGGASASWISAMRNAINYQHDYEAWMPYTKKSLSFKAIIAENANNTSMARLDISKSSDPIRAFLNVSRYLSALNEILATAIAARSRTGGSFGQRWYRLTSTLKK